MNKINKTNKIINYLFNFILFISAFLFSYNIFYTKIYSLLIKLVWRNNIILNTNNYVIQNNITIDLNNGDDKKIIKEKWIIINKSWEPLSMEINWKNIIVVKDIWNLIGSTFISYKKINWHYYFYTHNWPNTNYIWYFITNNLKMNDIVKIKFLSKNWTIITKKYKVYNIIKINVKNTNEQNIFFQNKDDAILFTCDENWKKRRIFFLKKIETDIKNWNW